MLHISSSNNFPLNGGFKINGQGREKGFGTPINFETPIRGIFCNVICNVIYSIRPALEHELQHYFLHKEILRTLRTTSTAGVNNFLWWIEWGLRNWSDQTKTKNTNQNIYKYTASRHRCSIAEKSMDVSQNPQSNRVANETPWQQWRRQGCCTERLWNQWMQIFHVEYGNQAEARATSSSQLDNSHWISFLYPASRHRCSIAEKSMDVSQNPQSNRVANETPWQQWRRQGCCTERLWNQWMQIFHVEYDNQAEARATSSSQLDNSHWISFLYPASRHRCSIAEKSMDVSQNPQSNRVANETPWQQWRRQGCCTERLWNQWMQIFHVEYDNQAEARATSSSQLDNSHWISFLYPASRHRCSIAEKSMDVSQNPQSNRVANETPWQQWRRQGCCTERLWNQWMQIFHVEYDNQAEARATSSSQLDNSHWISFLYPASRHRCSIAEKSMDVSQNPQSNRVASETPWQQWRRQGCCTERLWNQWMQIFHVEYDNQAEARATSSSQLDNSHWISFLYPASRHRCSIAEKSMDVSQNPQSNRVANETPW